MRPTEPEAPTRRIWVASRREGSCSPSSEAMVRMLVQAGQSFTDRGAEIRAA